MKKILTKFTLIMLGLVLCTCDNFFHDLIPESGNRITSFYLEGQMHSEIGENEIVITVMPGTSFDGVTPRVQVSPGATLFPITYDYISRSFDDERTFGAAMQIYAGGNMTENVIEMLRGNKSFTRPVIDIPINFSYPVDFLVVSGQGSVRKYTVKVVIDTGEGKFTSFRFDKFYNPELVRTASGVIDNVNRTVTVTVSYPVENIASYKLIPLFETNNARVYFDNGREIINAQEIFDYLKPPDSSDLLNPVYGTQEKTLTLKRTGYPDCEWKLIVKFEEDPDTSRSIIDFRFTKSKNPLISADYVAEITELFTDYWTINVTVYYEGTKPSELRADFIAPGTVRVNDEIQISGVSYQSFSSRLNYEVTSRVGNYTRTYRVTVNIVQAYDPIPVIELFTLNTDENPSLSINSTAMIDQKACLIFIEAAYNGDIPPYNLKPQFIAGGSVTVNGVTQTSGVTGNNFSSIVVYTVTNPANPTLKRDYRVEVKFAKTLSSAAEIYTFTFFKADNPELIADVKADINQLTGAITATLRFETPGGNRTLIPRWTSQGIVSSDGVVKNGMDQKQFYTPVNYRAISADGLRQMNYTVTIKELNSRIYVKHNANGRNDGTNWENAYTNLSSTNQDIDRFPLDFQKEVWIAEGIYRLSNSNTLLGNTSYIGGFQGYETSLTERTDIKNHRAFFTGMREDGTRIDRLFELSLWDNHILSIEDLIFTSAGNGNDAPLLYDYSSNSSIYIRGVDFSDSYADRGGAFWLNPKDLIISDCTFTDTHASSEYLSVGFGGAIAVSFSSNVTINNCNFINTSATSYGGAIHISNQSSKINISNCNFINTVSAANLGNAISIPVSANITLTNNNYNGIPNPVNYYIY